jgi:uncharacterized protein (DUF2132 family)
MDAHQPNNPLHGKTLEMILNHLVTRHGWEEMGRRIRIRCFTENPSITSSLKFLRRTPWARKKVERLFCEGDTGEQPVHKPPARRRTGTMPKRPAPAKKAFPPKP